ncbi:energy-coupling factor ABC transporter ATP-binding protein [Methanofollis fontis]|uniref:ABC transporter n=1 Tax=Methanofollis fontis TaxID=2052832 RepID=A0A483CM66_9EURY|nr:energy-coupling factor ABC transporter ATP-binding protein [Methanofollis fontis]TAJ43987.1 ABC transporter [Methanofollis fontis]
MIDFSGVSQAIVRIPSLSLAPGTTVITGPNGSGKSTFLRLCAGLALPESGSVGIDGRTPRETEVGWVGEFPDQNLLFSRVYDEIAGPSLFAGAPCDETRRLVDDAARRLGIVDLLDRTVRSLSGGERALVGVATALSRHPHLLVLDEFDSHLDRETAEIVAEALERCPCRYLIRCTQDMETAALADTLLYFEKGVIVHAGSPKEVFSALQGTCFYPESWGG